MAKQRCPSQFRWILALLLLQGCALFSPVSYYDPTTYRNIIELKVYTMFLYESFTQETVDADLLKYVKLHLAMAYEYEKGKGDANKETAAQLMKIREMFNRHDSLRHADGKWSETNKTNKLENMMDAFDIARDTELLKNKPR